jgi:DNA-directed RNA polymerase sigma subunit (sigma70/sigma32)
MLEPQEEFMLPKRWRAHGDRDAAHKLVTSHLRLVAKIAMSYRGYGVPISEVISEGSVGLIEALTVLNDRECRIFEVSRLADEPITLEELPDEFGVSRERVRQIDACAFEKVKKGVLMRASTTPDPLSTGRQSPMMHPWSSRSNQSGARPLSLRDSGFLHSAMQLRGNSLQPDR